MDSIQWLNSIVEKYRDREFIFDTFSNQSLTFGDMHADSCSVAYRFKELGIKKGDRVALILNNSLDMVRLYFGALYAGIVTVPINPILTGSEVDFILKKSQPKVVFVEPQTFSHLDLHLKSNGNLKIISLKSFSSSEDRQASIGLWDLSQRLDCSDIEPFIQVCSSDTMTMVHTSGTTGQPTSVIHRISDMIDNARLFNETVGIDQTNRFYNFLSLSYLGGYYNLLLLPYVAGSSVVLGDVFGPKNLFHFWKIAKKYKVNTLWFVPMILSILLELDRSDEGAQYCRDNIKLSLVGTAPLSRSLKSSFEAKYGVELLENYGLSETFFITTQDKKRDFNSEGVGKVLDGVDVKILSQAEDELEFGKEGEIWVKTSFLMEGTYSPESDIFIRPETWFKTGDLGILTADKNLIITGRKKDLIIRGGINISPSQIENVISLDPLVKECAVVGIEHKFLGEEVIAFVSLFQTKKDHSLIIKNLKKLCKENLAEIKQPTKFIFIENFPRSSSGKIQKKVLRELASKN